MQLTINKKTFICLGVVVLLCLACFCAGRFLRLGRASELGAGTQQQIEQLTGEVTDLKSELEQRIAECESLEQQLNTVGAGVDDCLGTARYIRTELEDFRGTITGSNQIVTELRRRIIQYEDRIKQLESSLGELKASASVK